MKRLLMLMILLISYLNAGMYGGIEWHKLSFDGTYKEIDIDGIQEWDTLADISVIGLNLGYGYADAFSGEVYFAGGYNTGKLGTNMRYGFDIFDNNIFPHILLGTGVTGISPVKLSNNPNVPSEYYKNYSTPFVQLGLGASYILNDTIELYGDILIVKGFNTGSTNNNKSTGTNHTIIEDKWDATTIGFLVGVKFHAFGSSTLRGKYLKEKDLELERERLKNIDSIFDN